MATEVEYNEWYSKCTLYPCDRAFMFFSFSDQDIKKVVQSKEQDEQFVALVTELHLLDSWHDFYRGWIAHENMLKEGTQA